MARVYFNRDFEYRPNPQTIIVYRAGHSYDAVRREAADQAVTEGAGRELKAKRRAAK